IMKKIFLITVLALVSLGLYAQENKGVKFEQGTLQQALNKAKSNKKGPNLVFLDCYTTWCGPCKYMSNTIFPMEAAGKYFNANFVNIKIDMEKGEGPELAKRFKLTGYPTFIILSSDGNEIGRVVGSNELDPFIRSVEKAKDIENSVEYLNGVFEKSKTSDNAINYVEAMGRNSMYKEITAFMNENLAVFNEWDLFTDRMWKYIKQGISYDKKVVLEYIIDNKMQANTTFGINRVNEALRNCYQKVIVEYLTGKRSLAKEEVVLLAGNMNMVLGTDNTEEEMCSKLAKWEATGNNKAIAEMFKFGNLRGFDSYTMTFMEEIFAKYDCITKQMLEQYYKSKNQIKELETKSINETEQKIMQNKK
ncbi:MAG: thioredoxin family protein, partial [Bacteroidales bacterium]